MKRILFILPFALICSCSQDCDNSTAEGAVDCFCDLTAEMEAAEAEGDEERSKEIDERGNAWQEEVDKHIEAGDYTKDDMEKVISERTDGCTH